MLFSRRAIQRMLEENAAWMPPKALRDLRRALNNPKEPSPLSREWELAVLNALSKIVSVVHEPDWGKRPDIVYQLGGETVMADVVTVSDRARHRRNPVEELNDQFAMRLSSLIQTGIKGGFCLSVGPRSFGMEHLEARANELHLPSIDRFDELIFNRNFEIFLSELRDAPLIPHRYRVHNSECNLSFAFSPKSDGWTLDKFRYTQSTILAQNPIWNALEDKRSDLELLDVPGHRGIVLCDGGCDTLNDESAWDHYSAPDIISGFLRETNPVEFVLTLVPYHNPSRRDLRPDSHGIASHLITRAREAPDWLVPIKNLASHLPPVCSTSLNARYEAEWRRERGNWSEASTFRGACTVSEQKIKMSARDLLQLLAGVLRQDAFEKLPFMARSNPFLQKLAQGQLITAAAIEKEGNEADDDWIVFEFGGPDPAATTFRRNLS
jgi:hypothetical protein